METILLCDHCIDAIRSRGERLFVGERVLRDMDMDEYGNWYISDGLKCEWCDKAEELYECHF